MRTVTNIFWGWMVALRALAIAAIPLSLLAGVYLALVYFVWSPVFSIQWQHRHAEFTWVISVVSIGAFAALTFAMHELGKTHRSNNLVRA